MDDLDELCDVVGITILDAVLSISSDAIFNGETKYKILRYIKAKKGPFTHASQNCYKIPDFALIVQVWRSLNPTSTSRAKESFTKSRNQSR